MDSSFFVQSIYLDKAYEYSLFSADNSNQLESNQYSISTDLICEGPIEGLVDPDGNLLKYIEAGQSAAATLGKGIYYNDVPIVDNKTSKYNFVNANYSITYGTANQYAKYYPSTVHGYGSIIYPCDVNSVPTQIRTTQNGFFCFYLDDVGNLYRDDSSSENPMFDYFSNANLEDVLTNLDDAKQVCNPIVHRIKNLYCDHLTINIGVQGLYDYKSATNATLVYEFLTEDSSERYFCIHNIYGYSNNANGSYTIQIPFKLKLNTKNKNNYYVKAYLLNAKIPSSSGQINRRIALDSISEAIIGNGYFSYPYSATSTSTVSSKHFPNDPARSFDLKLLKIKVPSNYDPETKEYTGNWDGTFSPYLKWTDNPAWIFYDVCTNSRYGVGNGLMTEQDINKWELYRISKFCDGLVRVKTPHKYPEDDFYLDGRWPESIFIDKNGRTLEEFKTQYPPIIGEPTYSRRNGGAINSIIYLFNMTDPEEIEENYKKIIWNVEEGYFSEDDAGNRDFISVGDEGSGSVFKLHLIKDLGPRTFLENEPSKSFYQKILAAVGIPFDMNSDAENYIELTNNNNFSFVKGYILKLLASSVNKDDFFFSDYIEQPILGEDYVDNYKIIYGKCLPRVKNYRDPLEPRFVANIFIDDEVECLKVLNDIASVFRGIMYYKNNYLTSTIDVDKPVAYLFNNTNVKNGAFVYSSGSIDGNYSVAKVLYKDQFQGFADEIEIVEDSDLIREYGIVSKEILGFGITTKDQARRIGTWLLMTNRFENQTVTFSTDLQGLILKPSDVIRIEDQNKNDLFLQGRIISVDYENASIVIDRKLDLSLTGKKIYFLYSNYYQPLNEIINSSELDKLDRNDVFDLRIERIENNTNTIYFSRSYNIEKLNRIFDSSIFIVENEAVKEEDNLYKIVTIAEVDVNEYSIFCIKHKKNKFLSIDRGELLDFKSPENNTISFAVKENLIPLDLSELGDYLEATPVDIFNLKNYIFDYLFTEEENSYNFFQGQNNTFLAIDFLSIKAGIIDKSSSSDYFSKILSTLNQGGGFICRIIYMGKSIRFKVPNNEIAVKTVFMGNYDLDSGYSLASFIDIYLYNKDNQIIEV